MKIKPNLLPLIGISINIIKMTLKTYKFDIVNEFECLITLPKQKDIMILEVKYTRKLDCLQILLCPIKEL